MIQRVGRLTLPGEGGSSASGDAEHRPERAGWGDGLSPTVVLQWLGFSLTRTIQLDINSFENRSQLIRDLGIPKADDSISFLLKPKLPFAVALGGFVVIMMSTVEFNDQTLGRTEEVYDIGTNRRLASEVRAIYWELLQSAPESALVRCRVGTESFGCCPAD